VENSDDEIQYGVWGPPTVEEQLERNDALTDVQKLGVEGLAPEQMAEREHLKERDRQRGLLEEGDAQEEEDESAFDRMVERKMSHLLPPRLGTGEDAKACEPTTTFHGSEEYDYKGRSWTAPPSGMGSLLAGEGEEEDEDGAHELGMDHHKCYVPKKCVHRFLGHNKGVHRIRCFPRTGHLLLSAGLDGKCKVWSTTDKKVMRTYIGHTAAVRDVQFNNDGSKFVSCSFDRYLRLWNTESGSLAKCWGPIPIVVFPIQSNFILTMTTCLWWDAPIIKLSRTIRHRVKLRRNTIITWHLSILFYLSKIMVRKW